MWNNMPDLNYLLAHLFTINGVGGAGREEDSGV